MFRKDLLERVGWTAAQGALATITVASLDIPPAWVPVIAAGLAAVKGFVAKHVGNKDSASLTATI